MAPQPSPAPAILIVEQYGALAAAIASALRKFAPSHRLVLADSLTDALNAARETLPTLVIIDCDPADPQLVETLGAMRAENRSLGFIAITTSIEGRLRAELAGNTGIAFIDKPFDLTVFGNLVRRMLEKSQSQEPRLIDLLTLLCLAGASASLQVKASARRTGAVHVRDGRIIHASAGILEGAEALQAMLCWSRPKLFQRIPEQLPPTSIFEPWQPLLLHALRYAKEATEEQEQAPAPASPVEPVAKTEASPPQVPVKKQPTGKKVVIVDDTELLLLFVEDVLSAAEPDLQITTASTGEAGVAAVTAVRPDLVLLDYSLPDFNGDEVCRRLCEAAETKQIPVLMMSGHVPQMLETATKFHNVIATVAKPFRSEQLVDAVRAALRAGPLPEPPPRQPEPPARFTVQPEPAIPAAAEKSPVPAVPGPVSEVSPPPQRPVQQQQQPAPVEPASSAAVAIQEVLVEPTASLPRDKATPAAPAPRLSPPQESIDVMTPVRTALPGDRSEVIMSLSLEVTAMQITPELRIGALRARPAAHTIVLRFASAAVRGVIPAESGFELGPAVLDAQGRIAELRVVPIPRPVHLVPPRARFEISDVSVVAANSHNRMQILPAPAAPMTVRLLARFELSAVELSANFQVAALALMGDHDAVRISLEQVSASSEQHASEFGISSIELDAFSRIASLQLIPRR